MPKSAYLRQSPLDHLGLAARADADADTVAEPGVMLAEKPFPVLINVRGDSGRKTFQDAIKKALGVPAIPHKPNTVTGTADGARCLWLGPDEWLCVATETDGPTLSAKLAKSLARQHAAVTDVSESRTVIQLSGPHARDVLAKGSPMDFHPRAFGTGQCAQTHLALANVLIHQVASEAKTGGATFDIYVLRSFSDYLWAWLEDAGLEYDCQVVAS